MLLMIRAEIMHNSVFDYATSDSKLESDIKQLFQSIDDEYYTIKDALEREINELEIKQKKSLFQNKYSEDIFDLKMKLDRNKRNYNSNRNLTLQKYIQKNYLIQNQIKYELDIGEYQVIYELGE